MIRRISMIMIIASFVIWIAWDIYAYFFGTDSTLSVVVTDWSHYTPMWPFLFGVLMGHWFWPAKRSGD